MADITLDGALDLEQEYYLRGYKDGQEQSAKEQFLEGKIYGLQTGFQRFLVVGYIQELIEEWKQVEGKAVASHVARLEDMVRDIPLTNGDEEVERYEKAVSRARNKIRVVATITKCSQKVAKLDDLIKEVGGSLQVSENVDEMW